MAPFINGLLPGMPGGKPAGAVCVNLDPDSLRCRIWGTQDYPQVCRDFQPQAGVCGRSREEAMSLIGWLEDATTPQGQLK